MGHGICSAAAAIPHGLMQTPGGGADRPLDGIPYLMWVGTGHTGIIPTRRKAELTKARRVFGRPWNGHVFSTCTRVVVI